MRLALPALCLPLCLSLGFTAQAGVYTDDLARCLVESSSSQDKTTLVKWMFTAMARHPDVREMSAVTSAHQAQNDQAVAALFMRLMTENCRQQSKKAVQYEGSAAIEQGFNVLGQVAGKELFANPDVNKALAGLEQHMDAAKLQQVLQSKD